MATGQGPEPKERSRYCGGTGAETVSAILLLVHLLYKCVQAAVRARETETGERDPQQPAKEGISLPRRDGDSSGYNSESAAGLSDLKFSLDRTAPPHLPLRAHQVALSYGSVR